MANMGYCRFSNTAIDLEDCLEHIDDELEGDEAEARERIFELCRDIVSYADRVDDDEFAPFCCGEASEEVGQGEGESHWVCQNCGKHMTQDGDEICI